jgi:lipopolysaccharide export system protein LptA
VRRRSALTLVLAAGTLLTPSIPRAQNFGLGLTGQDNGKPITIEAEQGIEWQQSNHVYIARGHAKATRGQATVFADTLIAYYRPVAGANGAAAPGAAKGDAKPGDVATAPASTAEVAAAAAEAAPGTAEAAAGTAEAAAGTGDAKPGDIAAAPAGTAEAAAGKSDAAPSDAAGIIAPAAAKTDAKQGDPLGGSSTEIYRLEADGNVRLATETQTVYCDHAVYDVDQTLLVATGRHLKLETPRDTVTARDSLEWYDNKQLAVARGDAVAVQEEKRLRGDVLTADVVKGPDGSSHISRIDAQGHVLVSSQDQVARGDTGVYNVDTGIATLAGHVTLTRADNELTGQYGVVDLNKNVSRLLNAPPGAEFTAGPRQRVHGLLVPRQKPAAPPAAPPQ